MQKILAKRVNAERSGGGSSRMQAADKYRRTPAPRLDFRRWYVITASLPSRCIRADVWNLILHDHCSANGLDHTYEICSYAFISTGHIVELGLIPSQSIYYVMYLRNMLLCYVRLSLSQAGLYSPTSDLGVSHVVI